MITNKKPIIFLEVWCSNQVRFSFKITGMPEAALSCKNTVPINFSVAWLTEEPYPERKISYYNN